MAKKSKKAGGLVPVDKKAGYAALVAFHGGHIAAPETGDPGLFAPTVNDAISQTAIALDDGHYRTGEWIWHVSGQRVVGGVHKSRAAYLRADDDVVEVPTVDA